MSGNICVLDQRAELHPSRFSDHVPTVLEMNLFFFSKTLISHSHVFQSRKKTYQLAFLLSMFSYLNHHTYQIKFFRAFDIKYNYFLLQLMYKQ